MAPSSYTPLSQQDVVSDLEIEKAGPILAQTRTAPSTVSLTSIIFLLSLSLNAIWAFQQVGRATENNDGSPTPYAKLRRSKPIPFSTDTAYTSSNRTLQDEAWRSTHLIPDTGLIAISDSWARAKGLPEAQSFPWNHSKSLYLLNGFHNLHCVHILRQSVLEAFDNKSQTLGLHHVIHCLNVLRDDVICSADDTPRYTGRRNQQANAKQPLSGIGQSRMCRDWGQLHRWAVEHTACYRAIHTNVRGFPPIERYKFCPNGEELWS